MGSGAPKKRGGGLHRYGKILRHCRKKHMGKIFRALRARKTAFDTEKIPRALRARKKLLFDTKIFFGKPLVFHRVLYQTNTFR